MKVLDLSTNTEKNENECVKAIIDLNTLETGYFSDLSDIDILSNNDVKYFSIKHISNIQFDRNKGVYTKYKNKFKEFGQGYFNYEINYNYEAYKSIDLFNKYIKVDKNEKFKLSNFLNSSIGLEFETCCGYIPQHQLFKSGLIPLKDGSIKGIEYTTVPLKGNEGINLLKQQIKLLKEYTLFDKDCSLHIHFGGFPLDKDKIFKLYKTCKILENHFGIIFPKDSFYTERYKSSGKSYCKILPYLDSFEELYQYFTNTKFFGNFKQCHIYDLTKEKKWNIKSRYHWVNFVNLLCYNSCKTIEFRFIRPTYNFKKILLILYILNAIIEYSKSDKVLNNVNILNIINLIYPKQLVKKIINGLNNLQYVTITQNKIKDYCGERIDIEEYYFDKTFKIT